MIAWGVFKNSGFMFHIVIGETFQLVPTTTPNLVPSPKFLVWIFFFKIATFKCQLHFKDECYFGYMDLALESTGLAKEEHTAEHP